MKTPRICESDTPPIAKRGLWNQNLLPDAVDIDRRTNAPGGKGRSPRNEPMATGRVTRRTRRTRRERPVLRAPGRSWRSEVLRILGERELEKESLRGT